MEIINKKFIGNIFIIFLFFVCLYFTQSEIPSNFKYLKVADISLKVEIVSTPELLQKGLSGREPLKEDEGMFFVFNYSGKHSFWMKDMNFPIDIIWIDKDFKVVYIKENVLPESYPETFSPDQDSLYVLEVVSNFSNKNKLQVGDKVEFVK